MKKMVNFQNILLKMFTFIGNKMNVMLSKFFDNGLGAKSQILSSVAPPRKKKLATIFSQGHV